MSDYGLLIKNNSAEIQIDSTYRNLSLDQSGSATIVNTYSSGEGVQTVSITSSPLVPLILIRPDTDYYVGVRAYVKSGSNFTGFSVSSESINPSSSTDIDWRCYRQNRTGSGESYGLLVYNSSGELCFDSGKSYFKVHSVHSIDLTAPANAEGTGDSEVITHTAISNPFYILSPNAYMITLVQQAPPMYKLGWWTIGIKKVSSTSVRVGWYQFRNRIAGSGTFAEGVNPTMKLLVCEP